ncbi:mannosyl-oligosaccharide alpha-1,2-mannosidase [Geosmithia morbida]|uniref:alpha-1,2-Mannosidase n=1 Tax=Geosmithia morbida TaxID=1094350 RepID=A0A9P5CYN2_9HYPO|nr:mannosyl-oligosaccharide alpha-1,2-mannosidase [Geosmithia morbida]KAF4119582.1 mannosyl-oligosaccharide alpha-1,2-mannosidase [Geosmithia morbida]
MAGIAATLVFIFIVLHALEPSHTRPPAFVPSSFDWSQVPLFYPPRTIKALPTGRPSPLPPIQAPASAFDQRPDRRRDAVRRAFKRSWDAYKEHAWLQDELKPISGGGKRSFGGWAATMVDSLDTLWIMGLHDEFAEASWAAGSIDFADTKDGAADLFETTIRYLGGLLSAYDLSGNEALLKKAKELGDMLHRGFDTPNNLPGYWMNFRDALEGTQKAGVRDPSAVPASLCLEFTRLSQITGDPRYYAATDKVTRFLERIQYKTALPGMWPIRLDFRNEAARDSLYTIGAAADSLYEYLPKMHALLGGVDGTYEKLYRGAMDAVTNNLLFRPMLPDKADVLFSGDAIVDDKMPPKVDRKARSQHLACFAGGMFGLGGKLFSIDSHVDIGERLARGCGWAYNQFPTGLMPEEFTMVPCASLDGCEWDEKVWAAKAIGSSSLREGWANIDDARFLLRPEAIESIFLLYRMTGKEYLKDMAWDMFKSIQKSTETELAYSSIQDVTALGKTKKRDSMESFWTAETLKYFYLIFSPPSLISLDDYVLNTEAHPFKRPTT